VSNNTKASKKQSKKDDPNAHAGFMNVPVTNATRDGLHFLKGVMEAETQGEVIERLVDLGLAVYHSQRKR
jgi:hypothetical protein